MTNKRYYQQTIFDNLLLTADITGVDNITILAFPQLSEEAAAAPNKDY